MLPEKPTCLVCNEPLTPLERLEGTICRKQSCRSTYQAIPKAHTCSVCRRPLTVHRLSAGVCDEVTCQLAAHEERSRQLRTAVTGELYQIGVNRGSVNNPELYGVAHLPSMRRGTVPLPLKRRKAFEAHLDGLIAECVAEGWSSEAPAVPPPDTAIHTELDVVSGQACAGCRGKCCITGGTHAWLTVKTIRRVHDANPKQTPDEIRSRYLALVGARPYDTSCVYHGTRGCLLPREMRADICNEHFCSDLQQFRHTVPEGQPVRAFMVWPEGEGEFSAAFVDQQETRPVKKRRPKKQD